MFGFSRLVFYLTASPMQKYFHLYHDCTRTGNVEVLKLWQLKFRYFIMLQQVQVFHNALAWKCTLLPLQREACQISKHIIAFSPVKLQGSRNFENFMWLEPFHNSTSSPRNSLHFFFFFCLGTNFLFVSLIYLMNWQKVVSITLALDTK